VWAPRRICDIEKSKKFKKATKIIRDSSGLRYEEKLRVLQLTTLRHRQLRGDMIRLYKYVTNKYDVNFKLKADYQSVLKMTYDIKGNRYELVPKLCKYILRKQFFVNRVAKLWNNVA